MSRHSAVDCHSVTGGADNAVRKSIVEKAQDVLATRGIQSHKKVPKLKNKRVPIKPSEDGSINMAGRQKAAPINGKGSYNPSWSDFVTAGSIVFPNFYEDPLTVRAVNEYEGVLFKYADGKEYTFPTYHAEVLAMFKVGISVELGLRKATTRQNNRCLHLPLAGVSWRHSALGVLLPRRCQVWGCWPSSPPCDSVAIFRPPTNSNARALQT